MIPSKPVFLKSTPQNPAEFDCAQRPVNGDLKTQLNLPVLGAVVPVKAPVMSMSSFSELNGSAPLGTS